MFRSRSWFGGGLFKPKNPHSLEHLKYLYNVLSKNQTVSENNRSLLVETLRSIAEILIWGDQNDSSVFDFFLEKNMLSFFLKIMRQKCGSYVCVQLLQTLNILFENIRDETSLYYLLSNNHVNSIIVHKFDFSDEEVMAYYISFLKTLSLKLNAHTVHFFYNEHTNDFPLYTEAIKFFNHPESMVRIAVRTLTLNVYRVDDKSMLQFIRDKTAAPYFSNLVWFIGKHVLELDACVRNDADHQSQNRLADLVAEHLDHLHYLNDILCLEICDLNQVLTDHLLNKLLIPLYIYSLSKKTAAVYVTETRGHVSTVVSLFLLSQVFLILNHSPLVQILTWIILYGNTDSLSHHTPEQWLDHLQLNNEQKKKPEVHNVTNGEVDLNCSSKFSADESVSSKNSDSDLNITDEEKEKLLRLDNTINNSQNLANRPFLESIVNGLQCQENDYTALFALCLLYAIGHNEGVSKELLDVVLFPSENNESKKCYNVTFVEKLIRIIGQSCQPDSKIRVVTLELGLKLLTQLAVLNDQSVLSDSHLAAIAGAKEESTSLLRNFYKSEEIFLDMFEDEYNEMKKKPLNVEFLMMDSNILLPPTGTPMTGIEFSKRLPCGEVERARRAIRVFFLVRELCLMLGIEQETQILPLTNPHACVQVDNVLDLNNSDLIACTVILKEGGKMRRFLVIDVIQLILVEPDTKRLGWGVAKFVGLLQDIEVTGDKDDSRCLHITVHKPLSSSSLNRIPLLSAKFIFDDHIRCMAAKQRLTKGRIKARQKKMHQIAKLLDLPSNVQPCPSPPVYNTGLRSRDGSASRTGREHRPLFITNQRVPGFAAALRRDSAPGRPSNAEIQERIVTRGSASNVLIDNRTGHRSRDGPRVNASTGARSREHSSGSKSHSRHRDEMSGSPRRSNGSPRMPRPRSEEIPLEDMRLKQKRENILLSNATNGKFQTPPLTPPIPVLPTQPPVVVPIEVIPSAATEHKEETSFTEENGDEIEPNPVEPVQENKTQRRRGQVETV